MQSWLTDVDDIAKMALEIEGAMLEALALLSKFEELLQKVYEHSRSQHDAAKRIKPF